MKPVVSFGAQDLDRGELLIFASERAQAGMTSSLQHANADVPGWSEWALSLLRQYACLQAEPFTIEQFRAWAYGRGLPVPAEERSFGSVTRKAIRGGVMVRVGYAPASSSNNSPKATYVRVPEF